MITKKVIIELEISINPDRYLNDEVMDNTLREHIKSLFKDVEVVQIDMYDIQN